MKIAALHPREKERLEALHKLNILDTLSEKDFDDIAHIASLICGTPIALISLIDESRQWFKSKTGLEVQETPRDFAICAHAILSPEVFVVPDSRLDDRFKDNPLVMGNPKVIFYAGAPLFSAEGLPLGTICVIDHQPRQISEEQKHALVVLSNQVQKLMDLRVEIAKSKKYVEILEQKKTAVENISEGVVLFDREARIVDFNPAALSVLGLSADQLTGKSSLDPGWKSIYEDGTDFPGQEHPSVVALRTGQSLRNVVMGIHWANLQLRWLQINSTPLFLPDSKTVSHVVTSFTDITEQKKIEHLLSAKKIEQRKILNGTNAWIAHWNAELKNISANDAYSAYFGKTADEVEGEAMESLLGPELFSMSWPHIEKVLTGQKQVFERELYYDGSSHQKLITYSPDIENGKTIGFFIVVADVTELKTLEIERSVMAAKMTESSRLSTLGEMAGGIAHEINTPLAVIITLSEILSGTVEKDHPMEKNILVKIQKIQSTAFRIAKIVRGLRLFSRNSGSDPLEEVSLLSIVDSTLDLCREKIESGGVALQLDVPENLRVSARSVEISQVLMNLVGNSLAAVSDLSEKKIELKAFRQDSKVIFWITDSGAGIDSEIAKQIFNPFFTTKEVGRGTGLGLSISKSIIESHGGRISYDLHYPQTRFIIELPALDLE